MLTCRAGSLIGQFESLFLAFELQLRYGPAQLGRESLKSLDISSSRVVFVTLRDTSPESLRSSVYASGDFCELPISRHGVASVNDLLDRRVNA